MDALLRRKTKPQLKPPDTLSRYVVTKHAWYKAYKRIFCITPSAIHTQNPERTLVLTNSYAFAGDSDIESVSLGSDEFEFVISARQDKKVCVGGWLVVGGGESGGLSRVAVGWGWRGGAGSVSVVCSRGSGQQWHTMRDTQLLCVFPLTVYAHTA